MAEKDREDLASVLEEALAEAEARAEAKAKERGAPPPSDEPSVPTLEEVSRRSVGGLRQVDESGLPPIRRAKKHESMTSLLADEGGTRWAIGWVVLREVLVLIGLFWVALIGVSIAAPEGGLGLDVIPLTLVLTVVLRLVVLGVSTVVRRAS